MITSSRLFKMPELCAWCGAKPAPFRRRVRWRYIQDDTRHDLQLKLPVCGSCRRYRRVLRLWMGGVLGVFAGLMLWIDAHFFSITGDTFGLLVALLMQGLVLWIMHHPLRSILYVALRRSGIEPPGYQQQVGEVSLSGDGLPVEPPGGGGAGASVEIVFYQPEFYKQFVRLNDERE